MTHNSLQLINTWPSNSQSNWNLEMLVFEEGGKPENPEKNPQSKGENQQQTQSTYDAGSGNWTRDTLVVGVCSHHCTTPAPPDSGSNGAHKYRILHGKCVRTVFTHELWHIRNRTSERSERVRFLIQNNKCVNTVRSTFHVVLCLLYTYWDWTPSLNYDKFYLNKCGQTTITERKQLRKKRKSSNKIQNLWNKVGLSEFKAV